MFTFPCELTRGHGRHRWIKRWIKTNLPLLRDKHLYPDTWKSHYLCPGKDA